MIKYKTTAKELRQNNNGHTYAVGYCAMQELLRYHNANAYTCGVYGWNCDVYNLEDGSTITTGYRGMIGKPVDYELLKIYETEARKISEDFAASYEEKKRAVDNLLFGFLEKLKKQ